MWRVTRDRWHMKCNRWHVTHDTWHMTHYTWHMIHDTWHMTCVMWHVVGGEHSLKVSAPQLASSSGFWKTKNVWHGLQLNNSRKDYLDTNWWAMGLWPVRPCLLNVLFLFRSACVFSSEVWSSIYIYIKVLFKCLFNTQDIYGFYETWTIQNRTIVISASLLVWRFTKTEIKKKKIIMFLRADNVRNSTDYLISPRLLVMV